jgi:hypothetical protein
MGFYGMRNKGYPVFSNVWKITGLNIHGFSGKTIAASVFLWENRVGVSEFDLRKKTWTCFKGDST